MLAVLSSPVFCQNTIISATVQDPTGQAFMYGSYTVNFVRSSNSNASTTGYCIHGNPAECVQLGPYTGKMDATGFFSTTLVNGDNSLLTPAGSKWQVTVCPNAGAGGGGAACTVLNIPVSGASQNLSTPINAIVPNIIVLGTQPMATAYKDSEIQGGADGLFYFRTSDGVTRVLYQGVWTSLGSGGGGASIEHTFNFISGDNAGNGINSGVPIIGFGLYAPNYGSGDVFAHALAANASADCPTGGCLIKLPNGSSIVTTPGIFNVSSSCPIVQGSGPGTILSFTTPPAVGMQFSCAANSQYGWGPRDFVLLGPGTVWQPNTSFPLNTYVQMGNYNDASCNIYQVTTAGTSNATTEPSWHTSCPNQGDTCTDGSEVLTNLGSSIGVLWSGSAPNNESHTGTMSGMNIRGFGCSEAIGSNAWGVKHIGNGLQTFVDNNSNNSGEMWTYYGDIFGGNDGRFTGKGFFVGAQSTNIQVHGGSFDDLQDWYEHGGGADLYGVHHEWYANATDDHTLSQTVILQGGVNHHGGSYQRSGHWYFDNFVNQQVDGNSAFDGEVSFFASTAPVWNANTSYDAHYVIAPSFALDPGNLSYENIAAACISNATTQPDWTTCQTDACTVADGTCNWKGHITGNANGIECAGLPCGTRGTGRTAFKIEGGYLDSTATNMVGGVANIYDPNSGSIHQSIRGGTSKIWTESSHFTAPSNGGSGATMYIQSAATQSATLGIITGWGGIKESNCMTHFDASGGSPFQTFAGCVLANGDYDFLDKNQIPRISVFDVGGLALNVLSGAQFNINVAGVPVAEFAGASGTIVQPLNLLSLAGLGTRAVTVTASGLLGTSTLSTGTVLTGTQYKLSAYPNAGSNATVGPATGLSTDASGNNITIPGTATIGAGTLKINGASIPANTQTLGTDSGDNMVATLTIIPLSLTTTTVSSIAITVPGMTASGHCTMSPTNALASLSTGQAYISAKTTNQIIVTHVPLAGLTYDILCTPF